jgi:threonine dehydratase
MSDQNAATVIGLADIEAARRRIDGIALRTPLVRLAVEGVDAEIHLKLENLQPIGSFKIRGSSSYMTAADPRALAQGVWTASAGNMAQGVAWNARRLGIPCTIVVPETAPQTKRAAIERLGGRIIPVPAADFFEVFQTRRYKGLTGLFVHAFSDDLVMAGNGTIGLEILEDLPDVDTVVIPWGGGGLSCGIATAIRAKRPTTRIYAAEVATAAPLSPSLGAGTPKEVTYTPSFVDGIGAPRVYPEMLELGRKLLDGALVSTPAEIAAAVRLIAERTRTIAEGAGAAALAAVLAGRAGAGRIVCVVSGGNIDGHKLATILEGGVP